MPSSYLQRDDDVCLPTLRDVVGPLFRYRRAVFLTFVGLLAIVIAAASFAHRTFEAQMKILVKRERVDPIVTGEPQTPLARVDVSESELYSEVELLTTRDLLEEVVLAAGVLPRDGDAEGSETPGARMARAVKSLRRNLVVEPVRRATMISVAYTSPDPQLAARVLDQLARLYLAKHLAVHRPPGAHQFFSDQTARFQDELRAAEAKLNAFVEREHVVSAATEKESTLQKLSEFEASLEQTEAAIADTTRRIRAVDAEMTSTPARQVTQIKDGGNLDVVRSLKAQILQLEIKRGDLLEKFTPQYPPVVQLEQELGQLRGALVTAEQAPLRDETTDQNPTYQWLRNEAARVHTERDALLARAGAIRRTVADYRERARRLDSQSVEQRELQRTVKAAEDSYLLYQRKREEARISDALDRTRIANVVIAEAPSVPQSSTSRRALILALGGFASLVLSIAAAYVLHARDPYFRTPDEVYRVLEVPVLATLPANAIEESDVRKALRAS